MKHVNEDFQKVLKKLKLPCGKKNEGFVLHSLRSFFKTHCIHSNVPREVVDAWQGHIDGRRSTASDLYYKLSDADSIRFMEKITF
jgi:hypothetical protein